MKRLVYFLIIFMTCLAAESHTDYSRYNRRYHSKYEMDLDLKEIVKDILVSDFMSSDVELIGSTLWVEIKVNKSPEELESYLRDRNLLKIDKEKSLNLIQSVGGNSEAYEKIASEVDIYSDENALFALQKGKITCSAVLNDDFFNNINEILIFYTYNGAIMHKQEISSKLIDIAHQLKIKKISYGQISKLIAEKTILDAGVLMNKKLVPYEIDFTATMSNIEITDNAYIYQISVAPFVGMFMTESDYQTIRNALEEQLGAYVEGVPFFKMAGSELFETEIQYLYSIAGNDNVLVKYSFNPYSRKCMAELMPNEPEIADYSRDETESDFNSKTLYSFQVRGKSGYFDDQCNVVVSPKFDQAGTFLDGMGMVRIDKKYGYINIEGKYAIEPQFEYAWYFSDGLASVKKNGKWGVINKNGEFVIAPVYDYADGGSEGAVAFKKDGKWGFVAKGGATIIQPRFSSISRFHDGLAKFNEKEKYGYVDMTGKIVIPAKYERAEDFSEGMAAVMMDDKVGFINKRGEWVIKPKFEYSFSCGFSESLAAVMYNGKYGYIDKSGQFVIPPIYDGAYEFSDGLAAVKVDNLLGFIDKEGNMVIEPEYDMTFGFEDGIAPVLLPNWKEGFIDKSGKWYDNKLDAYRSILNK